MDTIVLKFGGSSVADNIKLNIVAEKIKKFYKKNRIVVVVSAQGKATDNFIKEAQSLSSEPNERELDVLLSSGEQISMAKLSILLNRMEIPAVSLTGWQAGIFTNNTNQDAIIEDIDITRINKELNNGKIVIVAGFQGINKNMDITTLGRGGSDTTAVALAYKLNASKCYIFSDVDGVYTADPRQTKIARKIDTLSYKEMLDISGEGAKVLHNRCVEVGEKFKIPIIAKSTFNDNSGTIINNKIEGGYVKNIVKNDHIKYIHLIAANYSLKKFNNLYNALIEHELEIRNLINNSKEDLDICFTIPEQKFNKFAKMLEEKFKDYKCISFNNITRISIIGNGIMSNNEILREIVKIIEDNNLDIIGFEINETKISIMFKDVISNDVLEKLHEKLI